MATGATSLVSSSRFKLLDVDRRASIREFTAKHGLDFAAGKGFYELMKPELIQDYKEIVAVRRSDGSKVSGAKVRELLGIPASAAKFKLDAAKLSDFKVFVQSTSYNRALVAGTQFLYEVDGGNGSGGIGGGGGSVELTHERPPAPPSGAGMPIEIVFSFDTTASMRSVLALVRERLQELIQRLHDDIPGIRIAVFAHGDYDSVALGGYITKHVDFTTDASVLCDFVRSVDSYGSYDTPECYELVLKEARQQLSWTPGTQRALVMIGDSRPHEPADYGRCTVLKKFPLVVWKDEVDAIVRETGCRVYAVQCEDCPESARFWKYLAYHKHGYHLNLSNFNSVLDFILAICYREQGTEQLQAYRAEVEERTRASGGMNDELHRLFEALGVPPTSAPSAASAASGSAAPTPAASSSVGASPPSGAPSARKRKSEPAPPTKVVAKKARGASSARLPAARSRGGAAAPRGRTSAPAASPRKKGGKAASAEPKTKVAARKGAVSAVAAGGGKKALSGTRKAPTGARAPGRGAGKGKGKGAAGGKKAAKTPSAGRASATSRRPTRSPKSSPPAKKKAPGKPKRK